MMTQFHRAGSKQHQLKMKEEKTEKKTNTTKFNINDNPDILVEILKRLDDRSLGVAACVCRLWCNISRHDSLWENLCFRHVYPPPSDIRPVVVALGGYRKLYMVCLRPVLNRLYFGGGTDGGGGGGSSGRVVGMVRTREEVQLSLSLFSIDFYERLGESRMGGEASSSLMFLCNPVNV